MKRQVNWIVGLLMLFSVSAYAQQEVEMADTLRSEGKIYVIVGIILIILAGLFIYLFLLDRKVSRLEKQMNSR
jgi:hypothetical protein